MEIPGLYERNRYSYLGEQPYFQMAFWRENDPQNYTNFSQPFIAPSGLTQTPARFSPEGVRVQVCRTA